MSNSTLRHLVDFELEAHGWSTGDIRLVRRVLVKGPNTATERRLVLKYQTLRRAVVAAETVAAEKAAKRAEREPEVTVFPADSLDQIPDDEARTRAYQLAALWEHAVPGVAFPGALYGYDRHRRVGNWYVNGYELPGSLPAMICSNNRLTQEVGRAGYVRVGHRGYRYATVTLRTALARAKRGKELFNFGS